MLSYTQSTFIITILLYVSVSSSLQQMQLAASPNSLLEINATIVGPEDAVLQQNLTRVDAVADLIIKASDVNQTVPKAVPGPVKVGKTQDGKLVTRTEFVESKPNLKREQRAKSSAMSVILTGEVLSALCGSLTLASLTHYLY